MRRNIIANFAGRAWGFVSVYLFVPLYLYFLGIDAYGLVGFYSTLMGVLAFADMGITATLNREMARLSAGNNSTGEMRDLLRTYEDVYLCISFALAAVVWALAPLIAEHWLRSNVLRPYDIAAAIRMMGAAIALQMPSGLYIGGLMGLQRQVAANGLQVVCSAFRGIGAVLVLWLVSPTIFAFASWQLVSMAILFLAARFSLWRALSFRTVHSKPRFKWQVFRNTWRYAVGMAGMAVVSTLLTQVDKLAISRMLSLEMLGYYSLAGALAAVPVTLASPIALAIFPRFTGLVATSDRVSLTQLYHRTCNLVAIAVIPGSLTLAHFSGRFIFAWTGSINNAQQAGPVAALLLVGQLVQAISVVPFYLSLAHGNVRLYLYMGIASVAIVTPLLIVLIVEYGIAGAGVSWLVINLGTLPFYVYLVHRLFLPGEAWRWCVRDVGLPLLAALPCVILGGWLVPPTSSRLLTLCLIGLVWAVSTFASAFTAPEVTRSFMRIVNRRLRVLYAIAI